MIIGLAGPAGSGKTYASGYFCSEGLGNYLLESLASCLKEAAVPLFNLTGEQLYGNLKDTEDESGFTPRFRLQMLGDHCKRAYGDAFFADLLISKYQNAVKGTKIVVDDVRYLCEAEAIRKAGGVVIGIRRPMVFDHAHGLAEKGELHRSESEMLLNWNQLCDYEVSNDVEGNSLRVLYGSSKMEDIDLHSELVHRMKPLIQFFEQTGTRSPADFPEDMQKIHNHFATKPQIFLG